ncbi:mitotic-spindle organizing protein 1 [Stylonychia lemnae]|uniref:Mitotic-spindle organizing protein 1 n=1 Tax=Stylonychia lemnae TaxID=5949 RepID=A0A078A3R7_STYLE|nr:mitotic-spindle organizing protein 1 [Stylonychia lemnae]|eukprot:CDW76173.1 mitotic-spindle organizing protein 1 [Stylonychia lemnae]
MSQILNCGLDQRTLALLVALIENGVNPEALANVVKELKRETQALKIDEEVSQNRKQFR